MPERHDKRRPDKKSSRRRHASGTSAPADSSTPKTDTPSSDSSAARRSSSGDRKRSTYIPDSFLARKRKSAPRDPSASAPLTMPSLRDTRIQDKRSGTEAVEVTGSETASRGHRTWAAGSRTTTALRSEGVKKFIPFVIALVVILIAVVMYFAIRGYGVQINGNHHQLHGPQTLTDLVEAGLAQPDPGNLIAIDGSILEEGAGHRFEAMVNDVEEPDPNRLILEGDEITIRRGKDLTEPCDESLEAVPYEIVAQGSGPLHVIEGKPKPGQTRVKKGRISQQEQREEVLVPQHITYTKYHPAVGDDKVIALTFDDGPWLETTEHVLDVLVEHDVKATFFTVGEFIEHKPFGKDLVKRASDEGHQICTHSYDHAKGKGNSVDIGLMPPLNQVVEMFKGYEAIAKATGKRPSTVVRMPGGNFGVDSQRILRPVITAEIGWTIDSEDWKKQGPDAIVAQMMSVQPGGIILMHDGGGDRTQTVEALRRALPALKEQGYRFITIDEMLAYPPA